MRVMSHLAENLIHYALTHGIIYGVKPTLPIPTLPVSTTNAVANNVQIPTSSPSIPSLAVHAPFTLYPYQYPIHAFQKAVELAPIFNELINKISRDSHWLNKALAHTASSDVFTSKLLDILNIVDNDVSSSYTKQSVSLGIIRSDYMLHEVSNDSRNILQVEINTIASSFGSLSTKISDMHRFFHQKDLHSNNNNNPHITVADGLGSAVVSGDGSSSNNHATSGTSAVSIPKNIALYTISKALADAHFVYVKQQQDHSKASNNGDVKSSHKTIKSNNNNKKAIIVMVIQPGERNFSDQRHVHFTLEEVYDIPTVRLSLHDIEQECILDETTGILFYKDTPISVFYFRAGYSPDDYPSNTEWSARLKIEKSTAIKCPNIGVHLAGCKKVQQVLAKTEELEYFVKDSRELMLLKSVFAGLYSLDKQEYHQSVSMGSSNSNSNSNSISDCNEEMKNKKSKNESLSDPSSSQSSSISIPLTYEQVKQEAINYPAKYVMKPQREGGGNNIYGENVATALQTMSVQELNAYILMERIFPPSQGAQLVREGQVIEDTCLCELGIFAVYLSDTRGMLSLPLSLPHSSAVTAIATANDALDTAASTATATAVPTSSSLSLLPPASSSDSTATTDSSTTHSAATATTIGPSVTTTPHGYNKYGGYLLRVKPAYSDEGGVAAGYSVLSAPTLI